MSHATYDEEIHALEMILARVRQEKAEAEAERDDLRAKMDAIGELCPTHYEDRDELLLAMYWHDAPQGNTRQLTAPPAAKWW